MSWLYALTTGWLALGAAMMAYGVGRLHGLNDGRTEVDRDG
jgi:hypothetical protein